MSWHYLPELAEVCSGVDCSDGQPSVPSSPTSTAAVCSCKDSETACSTSSPSGMTCEHSTGDRGVDTWMSSQRGSRASRGPSEPVSSQVQKMNETCGPARFASLGSVRHDYACWRTSQLCLLTNTLEPFLGNWPRSGIACDGIAYRRRCSMPISTASGCGLWPTPTARDAKGTSGSGFRKRKGRPSTLPDALHEALDLPLSVSVVPQPTFVESVMGWPIGWTDLEPLATDKFHRWLGRHGGC